MMKVSRIRHKVNRRLFAGYAFAATVPVVTFGKPKSSGFIPRNELEHKVATWIEGFSGSVLVTDSLQKVPTFCVKLSRNQKGRFYSSLAENFTKPWVGENNVIELRSKSDVANVRIV